MASDIQPSRLRYAAYGSHFVKWPLGLNQAQFAVAPMPKIVHLVHTTAVPSYMLLSKGLQFCTFSGKTCLTGRLVFSSKKNENKWSREKSTSASYILHASSYNWWQQKCSSCGWDEEKVHDGLVSYLLTILGSKQQALQRQFKPRKK